MAKKRKHRRVSLGSPPSVHAKHARRLRALVVQAATSARDAAAAGKCSLAQEHYESALYQRGAYDGHVFSIGRHSLAFTRAAGTDAGRAVIAARKALEQHCGRAK